MVTASVRERKLCIIAIVHGRPLIVRVGAASAPEGPQQGSFKPLWRNARRGVVAATVRRKTLREIALCVGSFTNDCGAKPCLNRDGSPTISRGSGRVKYWQIIANVCCSLIAGAIAYAASGSSTDSTGALLAQLKNPEPDARVAAVRELQTSLDPRVPDAMLSLLSDEGNSIRRLAARAIWQSMVANVEGEGPRVRCSAPTKRKVGVRR